MLDQPKRRLASAAGAQGRESRISTADWGISKSRSADRLESGSKPAVAVTTLNTLAFDVTTLHECWLGRMDSNHRMAGSKPAALPTWLYPKWCGRRDLNSHAVKHWNLNPACLPIPPRPLNIEIYKTQEGILSPTNKGGDFATEISTNQQKEMKVTEKKGCHFRYIEEVGGQY